MTTLRLGAGDEGVELTERGGYRTRVLPRAEWGALAETDVGPVLSQIAQPDAVTVLVAEHAEGHVVGCWALINFAHLEGMWIHPAHRRRGAVLRRLWNAVCAEAATRGITSILAGASTAEVAAWIVDRGGHPLPFESFVLPLVPEPDRRS